MAPPLLKHQKSTFFNTLSETDHAPSAQVLPLCKSSGDKNIPKPNTSADQNITQHQIGRCEVAKMFIEAIVFTKTSWPVMSYDKYWMLAEGWILAIEEYDCQRVLVGSHQCMPSGC